MSLIDVKEIEEDIMESDLITDKIEQVRSEIEIFLSKVVDKTLRIASPPAVHPLEHVPTEHASFPTTPIVDTKAVGHSTPVKNSEILTFSVLSKDSSITVNYPNCIYRSSQETLQSSRPFGIALIVLFI